MGSRITDRLARLEADAFECELGARVEEAIELVLDRLEEQLPREDYHRVLDILVALDGSEE